MFNLIKKMLGDSVEKTGGEIEEKRLTHKELIDSKINARQQLA